MSEPYTLTFNYPDGSTKTVEVSAEIAAMLLEDQENQNG